ncbi:hypothetical protein SAMD00019534_026360 [Acytostelium subglobosum LB1]|uniref:hypothetical protein n=1 Tax=Acytostelium subglobosum LB1 TaxID=1410327 RepID=UPI000644970C|nr:hypothetical protein SAMD00019534_026360 [Acytostelium subglobosum LB1]GAM19461.1 hypothetical protein SAMD00019534_026360 [Acytostelium subglobosum LB1]|eukprot:XP_012757388.1 hypothetical protein SAMD00019534_026360 [Acytostelium subglobosum LB1]
MWKNEVKSIPRVGSITFADCWKVPLDKVFWGDVSGFLLEMKATHGPDLEISLDLSSKDSIRQQTTLPIDRLYLVEEMPDSILHSSMLPPTVTSLDFALHSDEQVGKQLDLADSNSIRTLSITSLLTEQPLDGSRLPRSLTELRLYNGFCQPMTNLPPSLTSLYLGTPNYPFTIHHTPLIQLWVNQSTALSTSLPYINLRELILKSTDVIVLDQITSLNYPVLEKLITGSIVDATPCSQPINLSTLPTSLTWLEIDPKRATTPIPEGVQHLTITFPKTTMLALSTILCDKPSSKLHTLVLNCYGRRLQESDIPSSLTSLTLYQYKQPLDQCVLKPSLRNLELPDSSDHIAAQLQQLPTTIVQLEICLLRDRIKLRRLSPTLFLQSHHNLGQYCFIHLDTFLQRIKEMK